MNKKEYEEAKSEYQRRIWEAEQALKRKLPEIAEVHWKYLKLRAEHYLKLLEILGYDDNEVYRTGERQLDTRVDGTIMRRKATLYKNNYFSNYQPHDTASSKKI